MSELDDPSSNHLIAMVIMLSLNLNLITKHFFARRGFLNRTQGKALETAPIVAVVKRTIIITRKTYET